MKIQIRRNVFETNSSSVHSITMCSKDDFEKWKNSDYYFYLPYGEPYVIGTREQMIELLKSQTWSNGTPVYSDIDWDNENSTTINSAFYIIPIKYPDKFKRMGVFRYTSLTPAEDWW